MADKVLIGDDTVMQAINDMVKRMGGGEVSIGFMNGATYPDGTPVAAVAFWNEFGVPDRQQPARPFFRNMISAESTDWGGKIAKLYNSGRDSKTVLAIMGEDIKGALEESINTLQSPPLAPSTIAAKGGVTKPLIDTATMLRAITYEVDK